jgi:hypothetical protein
MRFGKFTFGSIQIDGSTYQHDVIIDRGKVSKRKKKPSKKFRQEFGHTPLSAEEDSVESEEACYRYRRVWQLAGHGRSQTGGPTLQD